MSVVDGRRYENRKMSDGMIADLFKGEAAEGRAGRDAARWALN